MKELMANDDKPLVNYARQWGLPLDRAISYAVKVLRDGGVETFESCEGGPGHAFLEPTVRFHGGHEAGFAALACAMGHDLPVAELRRFWQIIDGEPHGPHWEMTFGPTEKLLQVQAMAERNGLIA
jgi:hypothetical protein